MGRGNVFPLHYANICWAFDVHCFDLCKKITSKCPFTVIFLKFVGMNVKYLLMLVNFKKTLSRGK